MADAPASEATETTTATVETTETQQQLATDDLGDGGKKALADERKARRDADRALKAAQAELDALREKSMSEQEKAVAAAKAEGRTEALAEAGALLVDAEVRAAAAGRNVDVDALLDGLDRSKFVGEDGRPDRDEIVAWVDRVAPAQEERGDGFQMPDLAQGTRTTAPALGSNELENALKAKLGIR